MTQYSRTITRMVTNALPTWRTDMQATNTLYEIGGLPTNAASTFSWPSGYAAQALYDGTDFNYYQIHLGYGGSVFVPDIGAYGSMVFGFTGESIIGEQLTQFSLSDDSPAWSMYQNPDFPTNSTDAASMGADWYYSPTDWADIRDNHPQRLVQRIGYGGSVGVAEASFSAQWDKVFPIGYAGWVMRRKYQGSALGNNRPHFFRYEMPAYIPPSMTGTDNGAIIVCQLGTIYGPFAQGPMTSGSTPGDWYADVWSSSVRKNYLYAMDVITKDWQRISTPLPNASYSNVNLIFPLSFVDEANKRLYYWLVVGGSNSLMYADFTSGISGMTWVGPTAMTDTTTGAQPEGATGANSVYCVPETGSLTGKRFFLTKDQGSSRLLLIDVDANTLYRLAITGLPTETGWQLSYDASTNTVYITTKKTATGVKNYRFTVPTNYTSAAAYSVSVQTIALNGITLDGEYVHMYGQRSRFHPTLGTIMLTQGRSGKMLAFRPA